MGMMPHPERASDPLMGSTDGLVVFQSMLAAAAGDRGHWLQRHHSRNHRAAPAHARRNTTRSSSSWAASRTYTELGIFSVMWSEHCSYKSSRMHLKKLPTRGQVGGAGAGRERRHHRYRRRLRDRVQDRIAQPPQLHRAVPGRGHRRGRHPARHFHHGRAAHRGAGFAAFRPAGRPGNRRTQPAHPERRGRRHRALRQLLRRPHGGRRVHFRELLRRQSAGERLRARRLPARKRSSTPRRPAWATR